MLLNPDFSVSFNEPSTSLTTCGCSFCITVEFNSLVLSEVLILVEATFIYYKASYRIC